MLSSGRIGRREYLVAGIALAAIKIAIDFAVAHAGFHRAWDPTFYVVPGEPLFQALTARQDAAFYVTLALIAAPFCLLGVTLTFARLRNAGMHPLWSLLFFVPVVNLLLFALLAAVPTAKPVPLPAIPRQVIPIGPEDAPGRSGVLGYAGNVPEMFPASRSGAMFLGALTATPLTLGFVYFGANVLSQYAWGIFFGMPFVTGLVAAVVAGAREPLTKSQALRAGALSTLFGAIGLLGFAQEGIACVIMASPIIVPLAMLGALVGRDLQIGFLTRMSVIFLLAMALPLTMLAEKGALGRADTFEVASAVTIAASPEQVWANVVAFPPLPKEPSSPWLRFGVARPLYARIDGEGVGAVRHCVFSTGEFVEPVTRWEPGRLLAFAVTSSPPPMREISIYSDVLPAHLRGFMEAEHGQFELERLADGSTRLTGRTWYRHGLFPGFYWRFWSDHVIHAIHLEVLEHVKRTTEGST